MKNTSLFMQLLLLITLMFICITLTVSVALLAGSIETSIFDFRNFNIANMIPVFIFGGLITLFTAVVVLLFTSRTLFYKIKNFFEEDNNK